MSKKKKSSYIDGPFYPWLKEMGESEAMQRLRKNSQAVNVLTMFITKFTRQNQGQNLCVTYLEAAPFMSTATFAKAKLLCCAFGFLYCREFGRLERNPSIYDLVTKWQWLSRQPEKLNKIERLLRHHERIQRIPGVKIKSKNVNEQKIQGTVRKKATLRRIERNVFGVKNEP